MLNINLVIMRQAKRIIHSCVVRHNRHGDYMPFAFYNDGTCYVFDQSNVMPSDCLM